MTNSELSKQIPLNVALSKIDTIVANHPATRKERNHIDLSMLKISEAAALSEKLQVEVEALKKELIEIKGQK
jgi:hypothetical protein